MNIILRIILAVVMLTTGACLLADAADWAGQWIDTTTNTVFTVDMEGAEPTVVSAVDLDDDAHYNIVRTAWNDDVLSWTIYIPDTEVTLTYTGLSVDANRMQTAWENNWDSGSETLERYDFSGVWGDESIAVWTTIERKGDGYEITRVEDRDDETDYEITAQSWQDGVLSWEFFIPSTDVTLGYQAHERNGSRLVCTWSNDLDASGDEILVLDGESVSVPIAVEDLLGVWYDASIDICFYVHEIEAEPTVTFVYDTDEETAYEIQSQSYRDGVFEWSILISASNTVLTYRTTSLDDDKLYTDWWNDGGSKGADFLLRMENPLLEPHQHFGDWTDTDINIRFHITSRDGEPYVDDAWDLDIDEAVPVSDQIWDGWKLSWTVYIEESDTRITYWADALIDGELTSSWWNGYNWGVEYLREEDGGSANDDPLAGVWSTENTEFVIERHNDTYLVMSIVDLNDGERYPVMAQSWAEDKLTFSYYVPSTNYTVQIEILETDGDTLAYRWSNGVADGEGEMTR